MSNTQVFQVTTELIAYRDDTITATSMEDAMTTIQQRLRETYQDTEVRVVACTWRRKDQET